MARYRAVLAYDGAPFHGFQRQAGATPTVQAAVEAALAQVCGAAVTITGAGRTDAGVHASGQVIAFDVDWAHTPGDLLRALNANLPPQVALQRIAPAAADFHPRFSARRRAYVYRLYSAPVRQPLWDTRCWHVRAALDVAAMQAAAALLVGEHDFATFGQPPQGEVTIRRVYASRFEADDPAPCLAYTITANAFLQRMVRSIMGTLVEVGRGAMGVDAFADALAAADRHRAGPTAPPHGLTLAHVSYEDDE